MVKKYRSGVQVKILCIAEQIVTVNAADDVEAIELATRDYGALKCLATRPAPIVDDSDSDWQSLQP